MRLNEIAKIQHYVPKFLLKNFTVGKKPQVWVFDKQTGKIFKSHVKNVASENGFYNFAIKGNEYTIEPSLSDVETHASRIVKDIVRKNCISDLTYEDTVFLSHFFALQFVRTKQYRQLFKDLSETLGETLRARGEDISQIKDYVEVDEGELKLHGIRSVLKSNEYAPYFLNKSWVLFRTTKGHPCYISDNPVTLQNSVDHGPYGNIGLAVQGIEIYFPLSKSLVLGMFCKSHEKEIRKTYEQYKISKNIASDDELKSVGDIPYISHIMDGFDNKATVPYEVESVINHNSLQVYYSSRFVFSSEDDFSLAEKMIRDNPMIRNGPKMVANYRDRSDPHRPPLPHHAAYGSVLRDSADPRQVQIQGNKRHSDEK